MSKRNKIKNRDDWARFAIGYLKLSRIVFEQIIEWNIGTRDNDQHKIEEVYLPAVFNLKHGIEILLKSLSIEFFEKEFLNESDYSHNIDDIFEKLKSGIGNARIKEIIKAYENNYPEGKGELNEKTIWEELKRLIEKYHNLDFLKYKIGENYIIEDLNNEAFRYPTNSLNISIDYRKMLERFTLDDVQDSHTDSIKLEKIFWQFYALVYVEKIQKTSKL